MFYIFQRAPTMAMITFPIFISVQTGQRTIEIAFSSISLAWSAGKLVLVGLGFYRPVHLARNWSVTHSE